MIYLKLFFSFLQIGLFSFGGGYAALPLIKEQVVTQNSWISMSEFTNLITISQMTPGPIAINAATFVGTKIAGVGGAVCATCGCVFPSCVIVLILAKLYFKYRNMNLMKDVLKSLRPAVVAMIGAAGVSVLVTAFWNDSFSLQNTNWLLVVIFAVCILLLRKTKLNPVWVMILAGIINTVFAVITKYF